MKEDNVLLTKSFDFSVRCVNLHKFLKYQKKEFNMSNQLLRSGTSVTANITEAQYAQSRADFAAKLSIARKEAGETAFWIRLLGATNYLTKRQTESILKDCMEILRMLQAITKKLYNK